MHTVRADEDGIPAAIGTFPDIKILMPLILSTGMP